MRSVPVATGSQRWRGVAAFNEAPGGQARTGLMACCSAPEWAAAVADGRPYRDLDALLSAADTALAGLGEEEIDAALAGHPRIGERDGPARAHWSAGEQSGVAVASHDLLAALAEGNRAYEERFGHVYLVCATGKNATELLALLRQRMANDPARERAVLRDELAKINRIRLTAMMSGAAQA